MQTFNILAKVGSPSMSVLTHIHELVLQYMNLILCTVRYMYMYMYIDSVNREIEELGSTNLHVTLFWMPQITLKLS